YFLTKPIAMIKTDTNKNTLKSIREKEATEREVFERTACEAYCKKNFPDVDLVKLSNKHKGLWFLPIWDENDKVEKLALMRPIDRHILSYASTKVESDGLYIFLEACMNECFLHGDRDIID